MSSARHLQHQSHSIVHVTSKTINISLAAVVVAVPHDNDNDTYTEQLYSNYLMFSDCVFIFCSASQRLFLALDIVKVIFHRIPRKPAASGHTDGGEERSSPVIPETENLKMKTFSNLPPSIDDDDYPQTPE